MRFYIKWLLIVGVFCFLASEPGKRIAGDQAYDVRVGLVCAFGDDAAFEALVRDTQRMLAARSGALDSCAERARRFDSAFEDCSACHTAPDRAP